MPRTIYCDEAGFTGSNLLDREQPYFTFATVAIEPEAAKGIVAKAVRDYGIKGDELKFARLVKFHRGVQAVSFVLESCVDRSLVSALHKRYCLASLFFEHIFEPILADQNSIFYSCGFHRFISNVIYYETLIDQARAGAVLGAFQAVIRRRDPSGVPTIFPTAGLRPDYSAVIRDIEAFFVIHQEAIAKDIADHSGDEPLYRWMLDLSLSSFYALLTIWGARTESLLVYCDESKPLMQMHDVIDMMVGRTDKAEVTFEGKKQSIVFNMAEPIHFVTSTDYHGIQLADVLAGSFAYALRNPREEHSRAWLHRLKSAISEFSVFPDPSHVDLREERAFVNALVLHDLVDRSAKRLDLFEGMPAFIAAARRHYPIAMLSGGSQDARS